MTHTRRKLMAAVAATLAAGLVGCGQKGPLYRPEEAEQDPKNKKQASSETSAKRRVA